MLSKVYTVLLILKERYKIFKIFHSSDSFSSIL
nr:MAG TPA: hypothetical protein [Caudoviricetes sp.]DAZ61519.1 MAG TPA: hypothetical protein [Caudoviricetes sp.]